MNLIELLNQPDTEPLVLTFSELDLPGDIETPVSAFLKLRPLGAKFLLESAEDPTAIGRYTFIGINPLLTVEINREQTLFRAGAQMLSMPHDAESAPFGGVKKLLSRFSLKTGGDLPLLGGLVGFTSYEIVQFFEPKLQPLLADSEYPLARYYFVDTLLVFDHFTRRMKLLRLTLDGAPLETERAPLSIDQIRAALLQPIPKPAAATNPVGNGFVSNFSPSEYEAIVATAQKHIFKGDIFQTVLARREQRTSAADGFYIYRALRMLNPSPYMFYLDFDGLELIGSSPEAMVKLNGRQATIRPIAGTRRRGRNADEDLRLGQELMRDEKECAEHVMLVDLGRNDLGRVCRFGSVRVAAMMELEHYSHVMHITSSVVGELRPDCSPFELVRAAFPAGTVSGAPKLRAMEIIADLEKTHRGPYAGAVGYFSLSGELDMCITIRTIVKRGNVILLQAGAGIVADSIPELEYKETANKIAALREAVRVAEEGQL